MASSIVARRAIAFARTTSRSAGAYCRRWSGVQDVFGVPQTGELPYGHALPEPLIRRNSRYYNMLEFSARLLSVSQEG